MNVTAYCLWSPAGTIRVRVGLRNVDQPNVRVTMGGTQAALIHAWQRVVVPHATSASPLIQFATFELVGLTPWRRVDVQVDAGEAGSVSLFGMRVFGREAPATGGLRFLVGSCYSGIDIPGNGGPILKSPGALVRQAAKAELGATPSGLDATILLGDQVYLDLPPFKNALRSSELADVLFAKYVRGWFDDPDFRELLQAAPVLMIADDHELWNNAPFHQWQICKTYTEQGRADWHAIASALYQSFQYGRVGANSAGRATTRFDLSGIAMLAWDHRFERTQDRLVSDAAFAELSQFTADVRAGSTTHGTFAIVFMGASLFSGNQNLLRERYVDKEPADYEADYQRLWEILSEAGVPVLVVGGDIHFSRAMAAFHPTKPPVYELISSPLSLIEQGKSSARIETIDFLSFGYSITPRPKGNILPYVSTSRSQAVVLSIDVLAGKRRVFADVYSAHASNSSSIAPFVSRRFVFLPEFQVQSPR